MNKRKKLPNRVKESEEKFRSLSLYDELTDLHNRRGFSFLAEQQLNITSREKKEMLLVYVDVDNMKWINDKMGHKEGDQALVDTANILRAHIRKADVLARIGGDEFAAVIANPSDALPEMLSARLKETLQEHNLEKRRRCKLSFSVGFARYDPASPCSVEELLDQADRSMCRNKKGKMHLP